MAIHLRPPCVYFKIFYPSNYYQFQKKEVDMAYVIDSSQYLFDKALRALWVTLKLILKLLIYLPLWFVGYFITSLILEKNDDGLAWIGLITLFAVLTYQIIFFIKGIIIGFMSK